MFTIKRDMFMIVDWLDLLSKINIYLCYINLKTYNIINSNLVNYVTKL